MTTDDRIKAFAALGDYMKQFSSDAAAKSENALNEIFYADFQELIKTVRIYNQWFTEENVRNAIAAIADGLNEQALNQWLHVYRKQLDAKKPLRIAVIMAGNIPLAGFHDMLCILLSGNKFIGKLSSDDKYLMPFISKILAAVQPEFKEYIEFTEDKLKNIDAVIATGSNNSSRYFEYYFGKYPHIIRKNRNSAAVLTGKENADELRLLGEDVFRYFGLGCRNVSKLFVPRSYDFDSFYRSIIGFQEVINNNKYVNNYEYNRTVYLMSSDPTLLDNNFLLLKKHEGYSSPVGVLYYEYYDDINVLNEKLINERDQIQCIVSGSSDIKNALPFGTAQRPGLADYADGVDTMKFLTEL
jgi:hypothetical protein